MLKSNLSVSLRKRGFIPHTSFERDCDHNEFHVACHHWKGPQCRRPHYERPPHQASKRKLQQVDVHLVGGCVVDGAVAETVMRAFAEDGRGA